MTIVNESIAIRAPIARVFDVISDFASYAEFIPEIIEAEELKRTKTKATVAFAMKMMAEVDYTLSFTLKHPNTITWTLVKSDVLKTNSGSWKLQSLEKNLTDATFSTEMDFKIWVPRSLVDGLIASNLKAMLERFRERAEGKA